VGLCCFPDFVCEVGNAMRWQHHPRKIPFRFHFSRRNFAATWKGRARIEVRQTKSKLCEVWICKNNLLYTIEINTQQWFLEFWCILDG